MASIKLDISSENFDYYFAIQSAGLTEKQKDSLPKQIIHKLHNGGGIKGSTSYNKLSFIEKALVLVKAFKKNIYLVVEDENGLCDEDFAKYKKLKPHTDITITAADESIDSGAFILAKKEVIDTYWFLNLLCASRQYSYAAKLRSGAKIKNKTTEWVSHMNFIMRMMSFYESNRKRIATNTGLTMADWLVLIHIYHGNEVVSSPIYKEWYRYSCNSSSAKIKTAFSTLQQRGLIEKIGVTKNVKLKITPLGKDKINELAKKYILNC